MANPLYQQINSNGFMSSLNALKANPMQFLMQRKFNVPKDIQGDPNAILQHLLNTGQVSQAQYTKAQQIAGQFKR